MLVLVLPLPATFLGCLRRAVHGVSDRALILGTPPFASLLDFLHNPLRDHASRSFGLGRTVGAAVSLACAMLFGFPRRALRRELGGSLIFCFPPDTQHLGLAGGTCERIPPAVVVFRLPPGAQLQRLESGAFQRLAQFTLFLAGPALSELLEVAARAFLGSA